MWDLRADLCQTWYVFNQDSIGKRAPDQIYTTYDHASIEMQLENQMQSHKPGQVYIKYDQCSIKIQLEKKP